MSSRRLLIATILATALMLVYNNHSFTNERLITTHPASAQVPPAPAPAPLFPDADDDETIAGSQLSNTGSNQSQLPQSATPTNTDIPSPPTIQISSHQDGSQVPVGELTIQGTSSDNQESNCQVYADVNDISPLQNATAGGAPGGNDYSQWTFTYSQDYQLITQGVNELTAKISCFDNVMATPLSKWHSVNVTGVVGGSATTTTTTTPIPPPTGNALGIAQEAANIPSTITSPSVPFVPEEPSATPSQDLVEGPAAEGGSGGDDDDDDGGDDDDDDDGGEGDDG